MTLGTWALASTIATVTAGLSLEWGPVPGDLLRVHGQRIRLSRRLREAGLAAFDERDTTCCYALQDKVWVHDPAGAPWEVYTVKDDDPVDGRPATASLPVAASQEPCCA